jgi:stage III sporulation protein AH
MSMIIGRKQIILAALVVALGAAIYLNYAFAGPISNVFSSTATLGSASYVDNQKVSAASGTSGVSGASATAYFAQARLLRTQARDKSTALLKTQTTSATATATDKQAAETAIETIAKNINTEMQIESTIKAKGFSDCVAFINQDTGMVTIAVKPKTGSALSDSENAQIDDAVLKNTKVSLNKISIMLPK